MSSCSQQFFTVVGGGAADAGGVGPAAIAGIVFAVANIAIAEVGVDAAIVAVAMYSQPPSALRR